MKNRLLLTIQAASAFYLLSSTLAAETGKPLLLQAGSGAISFDAATNFSTVSVHGKANTLQTRVRVRQDARQLIVEEVSAKLPVGALSTGMGLRDEHMKKYIFTTADGQVPDLKFSGENQACALEPGNEAVCKFSGKLTVRGVERPFNLAMKIKQDGAAYRAAGDGLVKLSDYGIERPSQFGVQCADEVKVHIEFPVREVQESTSRAGGGTQ